MGNVCFVFFFLVNHEFFNGVMTRYVITIYIHEGHYLVKTVQKGEKNAVHLLKLKGTPEKGKLMKKVARDQVAKNAPAQLEYVQNQRLHIMHFYIIVILDYGKSSGLDHSHMNDYSKKKLQEFLDTNFE